MSEETKVGMAQKTRRAVVTTAAQVAVTAPAVGLILSATTQPAAAALYGSKNTHTAHDDPNFNEDVDAIHLSSNTNIFNFNQMVDDTFTPPA